MTIITPVVVERFSASYSRSDGRVVRMWVRILHRTIIHRTISTPWGVCSPCCQMCSATSLIKHSYHLCPHRSQFIILGEEKQL